MSEQFEGEQLGKTESSGKVFSCNCEVTEKTYHLKIQYKGEDYFYIVSTLDVHEDDHKPIITGIRRGTTYWACMDRLKNSDKKKIKKLIEDYFNLIIF